MPCTAKTPPPGLTCRAAAGPPCTRPIPGPELQRSSTGRSLRAEPPNRNRPLDVDIGQLAHREVIRRRRAETLLIVRFVAYALHLRDQAAVRFARRQFFPGMDGPSY